MKKIYTDDEKVKYVKTTVAPERTRDDISEVLRKYDTSLIAWQWKPEINDVYVMFQIEEILDGIPVKVGAKVSCLLFGIKPSREVQILSVELSSQSESFHAMDVLVH